MRKLFLIIFAVLLNLTNLSFASPKAGLTELLILTEQNPELVKIAITEAMKQKLPLNIYTGDKVLYSVMSLENGRPVYGVFTDINNPYKGGYTAFYEEFRNKINFSRAIVNYNNEKIMYGSKGNTAPELRDNPTSSKVLMITESTFDRVYIFDQYSGDLIDTSFIPHTIPQFSTPFQAIQHFGGSQILVSDQITDVVQRFNPNGVYNSVFAPAGGVNNAILDNIRGIDYLSNNNLLVTVGSGGSINTVQQFDPSGNPLGAFISGNIISPFGILQRQNDILISCSTAPNDISRFDPSGNFLSVFHSSANLNFAEQMVRNANGDIAVCGFSLPSGLVILDSTGAYKKTLSVVTGNRGVYLLGNGHYLTTAGTNVHEIDSSTGAIIRTIVNTINLSFRYISEYNFTSPSLRLTVNMESCPSQQLLKAELRSSTAPYNLIDSQSVNAGSGIPSVVSFPAAVSGVNYYIVVKGRNVLPTWSSNAVPFVSNYLKYNFTTASTQAYGGNMINAGGKWSLYQGDVDQNEFINLTDVITVYNDASNFVTGNVVTDLNCDDFVDLTDIVVVYTNSSNFVQVIRP